jgi:hypothetical protein
MKNTLLLSLGVLLSAGSLLSSCSSDDGASDDSPVGRSTWTLTVKATKGGNEGTTRALSLGGTGGKTLYATWARIESVHVYAKDATDNYLGVLHPDADAATAILIGSLEKKADNYYEGLANSKLDLQFPQAGSIYYTEQKGTLENISSNYDWATATVEIEKIDLKTKSIIPHDLTVKFENLQAIVKFTLRWDDGNGSLLSINPTALTVSYSESDIATLTSIPTETYTKNGDGILYVAIPGFENKTVTLTAKVGNDIYSYTTKSPKTFANGNYYDITVKMTQQQ